MEMIAKVLTLVLYIALVTACYGKRCEIRKEEASESIKAQEKLVKMKEQVVDKGSK